MNIKSMTGFERFRRKALISRAQLAEILEVSVATVGNWETGKSFPTTETMKRLARMYGVTVDELLRTDYPENDLDEPLTKEA